MKRSYIEKLKVGEKVLLKGWVYDYRSLAKLGFLVLRDSTGMVQCISKDSEIVKQIAALT